ncbi:xanthine/uracil permease [Parascardovia denticolens IPLA 20019]|uniref:uracil-xanthine permease family protein n=1 Tax=Parascardovia denticolens TaxID=78258 RepID=UPI0002669846|nr:nucleobase:cation symporter-2 family protein [Parascardovia denticolens]EIT87918.1 xanthine/uracil permease [Parascardovia denticolens IPLA 20019]
MADSGQKVDTAAALRDFDAKLPFWKGIPFGLQHVMAMFVANLTPLFLIAGVAKMNTQEQQWLIQGGLLAAGLGTALQLFPLFWGRIGSRLPMVAGISFTYFAAAAAIASKQGYGAVMGAVLVGGLFEVLLGLTATWWRKAISPIVSAVVVTSIGFSLLSVGAKSFGGGDGAKDFGSGQNITIATVTLICCLSFQFLAKGTAKQLSVLFGLVVGYILALILHKVDFSSFHNLSPVSLPHFLPFKPVFDRGAIISFALLYLVSAVEVLGDTAALTDVGFDREPTSKETAGAIAGDGLISSMASLFGVMPLTSFAQNIGLVAMTKVVNRRAILSGAGVLVLASFFPPIAAVFNSLPQAVLGGCTIVMFGNIVVSGFQMIARAGFSERNITIVALSLTMGIGFTQVPDIFKYAPSLIQQIFGSNAIAIAFVVALILSWVLPRQKEDGRKGEDRKEDCKA